LIIKQVNFKNSYPKVEKKRKRFKEIAEILGISTKAVEKRIYGALTKLRQHIKEL